MMMLGAGAEIVERITSCVYFAEDIA